MGRERMADFSRIRPERIEGLSDIIFGLALSLTAVQLTFNPPDNQAKVVAYIVEFVFSFWLIVWVWMAFTRIMGRLTVEPHRMLSLNVLLLLLISIEPYLLFYIWAGAFTGTYEPVLGLASIAWSVIVAATFLILGLMVEVGILRQPGTTSPALRGAYVRLARWRYAAAGMMALGVLPWLWSWSVTTPIMNTNEIIPGYIILHATYVYWAVVFAIFSVGSLWISRRGDSIAAREA